MAGIAACIRSVGNSRLNFPRLRRGGAHYAVPHLVRLHGWVRGFRRVDGIVPALAGAANAVAVPVLRMELPVADPCRFCYCLWIPSGHILASPRLGWMETTGYIHE